MTEGLPASARQANNQLDQQNKYARVIAVALARKQTREDLVDDRRIMHRVAPPAWTQTNDES